jgi:restriction system protein
MNKDLSDIIRKAIEKDSDFEKQSNSRKVATKTIYATFHILKDVGGQLPGREVINHIRKLVDFTEWETKQYEKTGNIRWESILHFYTIDCIKAGFLRKGNGNWILTDDGEDALKKFTPTKLLDVASEQYRKWQAINKKVEQDNANTESEEEEFEDQEQLQKANLDHLEEQAISGLKDYVAAKNPYDFQDMVAALLRAMGYYTPFIATRGRDGGLDIVAYQDPLGTKTPRIKVQVKHRPEASIAVTDIRSLTGLLNKDGDVGLFVTSGSFTSEAERFARDSHLHVKLIDFDSFINLWKKFYDKLTDDEKNMLPLHPIYFLGSNE